MKHNQFEKYFSMVEEKVRRDINMFGIEEAQRRLLREMRSGEGTLTRQQIGKLQDLAFKF